MNTPANVIYVLTLFSDKENSLRLNETQYTLLKGALNRDKFVEIDGSLYNSSDVRGMKRTVESRKPMGSIGSFVYYTAQELEEYLATK